MKNKHTAQIEKPKSDEKFIRGNFEVVDGKLSFTCSTQNVSFDEVLIAIKMLKNECERQIKFQYLCPFHSDKAICSITKKKCSCKDNQKCKILISE